MGTDVKIYCSSLINKNVMKTFGDDNLFHLQIFSFDSPGNTGCKLMSLSIEDAKRLYDQLAEFLTDN